MKRTFTLRHLILSALGGALALLLALALILWTVLGPQGLSLVEAWGAVQLRFVGEYEPQQAADSALRGLVDGLGDRWSYYLDADSYAAQTRRRDNSYVGIGVTVSYEDPRGLLVQEVRKDGPAAEAGVKTGDLLVAVDGVPLEGEARYQGTEYIQGEEGTPLTLTVQSPDGTRREVTLRRAAVENRSVEYEMLSGKVGYVRVFNFYTYSAGQLKEAVEDLKALGAEAFLFDMRNNGGGYVKELTDMLDYLLPEGPIFRSETREGKVEVTQSDPSCLELPMATLVNGGSYSAAEFFAAQLQESVGAPVVGEPTSGKGYSQQVVPLPGGGALNLSTGRYTTGGGVSLVGAGVTLDVKVVLSEEESGALADGRLEPSQDPQIQAALDALRDA